MWHGHVYLGEDRPPLTDGEEGGVGEASLAAGDVDGGVDESTLEPEGAASSESPLGRSWAALSAPVSLPPGQPQGPERARAGRWETPSWRGAAGPPTVGRPSPSWPRGQGAWGHLMWLRTVPRFQPSPPKRQRDAGWQRYRIVGQPDCQCQGSRHRPSDVLPPPPGRCVLPHPPWELLGCGSDPVLPGRGTGPSHGTGVLGRLHRTAVPLRGHPATRGWGAQAPHSGPQQTVSMCGQPGPEVGETRALVCGTPAQRGAEVALGPAPGARSDRCHSRRPCGPTSAGVRSHVKRGLVPRLHNGVLSVHGGACPSLQKVPRDRLDSFPPRRVGSGPDAWPG